MPSELHVFVAGSPEILRFTDTVRLGRDPRNAIVVDHEVVSSEHLELQLEGDVWTLVDLNSTNGTFVEGTRVARARLDAFTKVRLGPGGPQIEFTVPGKLERGSTRELVAEDIADRYFAADEPEGMSTRTAMIRAAFQQNRQQDTTSWIKRLRTLRVVIAVLVLVAAGAGGVAAWQARRVAALRVVAGGVFNTMKAIELDVRRLQATAVADSGLAARRERLERQYEDLLKTLGIYSDRTPADVQLIYRTVHRLGESEATVPQGVVDEVRKYIKQWRGDWEAGLTRARAAGLGPEVSEVLRQHHLPREFFYIALQESKLDTRAIGPSTRSGVPKGLWQLIPSTAQAYGLRLGALQGERVFDPSDERHDPGKSTAAAARYLADLYTTDAQASGLLVMASYNMGETRLRSLLRSLPASPAERNFWDLLEKHRDRIPVETYNYVFRVVAAAVIGANPRLFGFDLEPPLGELPGP